MEAFENGFRALHQRNFKDACKFLTAVIESYPDEKDLHERARVYIAICNRQSLATRSQAPRTIEERLNAATVAINRGLFDESLKLLRSVEQDDPGNDLVHYMLAVALGALSNPAAAVPHLRRAVELNSENRYLAMRDADLDPLRQDAGFAPALEISPPSPRRPAMRSRSGR